MKKTHLLAETRRVLSAMPSVFSVWPRTDYMRMYPAKSAAVLMNEAWGTTARDLRGAIVSFERRNVRQK